ncbi:MAG: sugar phosphate isomerase/epimerase family protein [Christensenellales bacterium]|jgi:sugar phosphate isomerase/epimerase
MKLSVSFCALNGYLESGLSYPDALSAIRQSGFRYIDFDVKQAMADNPELWGCRVRRYLEDSGICAPQAHSPIFNPLLPENRARWSTFENSLLFCKAAGIPQAVVHPGAIDGNSRAEFFENNIAFYRSLIPACEQTGVDVLIENIGNPADPYFLASGADLAEMVDGVNHPLFTACWDVGHANHFWSAESSQYASLLALGSRLTALHVHDNCGYFPVGERHNRIDMHTFPYASLYSNVNFDAVIKGLCDIGYQGTFNFEVIAGNPRRYVSPFLINGREENRLRMLPIEVFVHLYRALYEAGKYMLSAYGVFEE